MSCITVVAASSLRITLKGVYTPQSRTSFTRNLSTSQHIYFFPIRPRSQETDSRNSMPALTLNQNQYGNTFTWSQYPQYCPCLVPTLHLQPLLVQARFARLPSSTSSTRRSTDSPASASFLSLRAREAGCRLVKFR